MSLKFCAQNTRDWFNDLNGLFLKDAGGVTNNIDMVVNDLWTHMSTGADGHQLIGKLNEAMTFEGALPDGMSDVVQRLTDRQAQWDADNILLSSLYTIGRSSYSAVSAMGDPFYRAAGNLVVGSIADISGEQIGDFSLSNIYNPVKSAAAYGYRAATGQTNIGDDIAALASGAWSAGENYYDRFQIDRSRYGALSALNFRAGDIGAAGGTIGGLAIGGGLGIAGRTERFGSIAAEAIPTFRNLAPLDEIIPARLFPAQQVQRVGYTGRLDYVVLESGELVLGRSGHISLSQGTDVLAAGEAKFFQGAVKQIDNLSGHYRPTGSSAWNAAEAAFIRSGFDATGRYRERRF